MAAVTSQYWVASGSHNILHVLQYTQLSIAKNNVCDACGVLNIVIASKTQHPPSALVGHLRR